MHSPHKVVEMFEENMAEYTGAPYAVACDNCTNAIKMCCDYYKVDEATIPKRTYLSVPQSIIQAGGKVKFEDLKWKGVYQLKPYPIYDAAKRLTSKMYIPGTMMCLSFHIKKHRKIGKGGMILTDSEEAAKWFRKGRYEGRGEVMYHEDSIEINGWNAYMSPEQAARGLVLLSNHPAHIEDQIEDPPYRDLREFDMFREKK